MHETPPPQKRTDLNARGQRGLPPRNICSVYSCTPYTIQEVTRGCRVNSAIFYGGLLSVATSCLRTLPCRPVRNIPPYSRSEKAQLLSPPTPTPTHPLPYYTLLTQLKENHQSTPYKKSLYPLTLYKYISRL